MTACRPWAPGVPSVDPHVPSVDPLRAAYDPQGALAALHGVSAKTVAYLLGQLRATPRSRIVSRAAGPEVEHASKFRPWEIKARA